MGQKRGKAPTPQKKSSRGERTRTEPLHWILAISLAVVVVLFALSIGAPSFVSPEVDALPVGLQTLLRCAELCSKGPSRQDEQFSDRAPAHVKKFIEQDLRRACTMRCEAGLKTDEEMEGALPLSSFTQAPEELEHYLSRARQCTRAPLRGMEEVFDALDTCGVAHLPAGLVDDELFRNLQSAYRELRENSDEYKARSSIGNLRDKRIEVWPPFRWPFNSTALLQPQALALPLKKYFGQEPVFDHMSIIVSPASKHPTRQRLHADVISARRHIEVHIPLLRVTNLSGPTRFCPASHGFVQSGTDTNWVAYALEQWYFTKGECQKDIGLSYAKALELGQSSIYDSNVWHAGTENVAGIDRPVLQLSWSADIASLQERDYLKEAFSKDSTLSKDSRRQEAILADAESFRRSAGSQ